ncbi:MAG: 4Fe-4S dicluster domain-containing protein [Bacillota bacterium]
MSKGLPLGAVVEPGMSRAYPTGQWRLLRPMLSESACNGCGICDLYCPDAAIAVVEEGGGGGRTARIDYFYCKGCGICAVECPRKAIDMAPEPQGMGVGG